MQNTLLIDITKDAAEEAVFPDSTRYSSISQKTIKQICKQTNASHREIEIIALENQIIPQCYARNMKAFSPSDQSRLLQSSAAVVGLGGLGGTVAELLARTGVGKLTLIDGDVFEESNLNRQLLSSPAVLGESKAKTALDHLCRINPAVELKIHTEYLDQENCHSMVSGSDIVVDCLDNLKTRFLLEKTTKQNNIPLVYGAVGGHTGQVMTIFPEDSGLEKIYGNPASVPEKGIEAKLGTLSPAVFMVASVQCAEAIKVLLNRNNISRNKLVILDPFDLLFDVLQL